MDERTQQSYAESLEFAASKIALAIEDRDEAITDALLAGVSPSIVAAAVGLTRQRVWQIGRAAAPVRLG